VVLREGRGDGMNEEDGASLLRDLARAMCALSVVGRTGVISLPYPPVVQRALDRAVWVCLDRDERPPGSVAELVAWCGERASDRWPFPVPAGFLSPGSVLVDPRVRMPTRTCVELSADGSDDAPDQVARQLILRLSETSADARSIDSMRAFLIDHPILDRVTARRAHHMAIWRRVRPLYVPVPAMHRWERFIPACPTCGLLARLDAEGGLAWCESELCPHDVAVPDPLPAADEVMLLCDPLRQFVALPGRTEQQLRADLADLGVDCSLVDAADGTLELSMPVRGKRIVRVVDRIEPALLAAAAACWPDSLVAVPDRLIEHNPAYRTAFADAGPPATDSSLISVTELVALARAGIKENRHA
jgi:pPIWI_RE three-gene island domain Y